MSSAPGDVRNRIAAALQRASALEERLRREHLDEEVQRFPALSRAVADLRRLTRELQLAFEDLSQAMAEEAQAKASAAAAERTAMMAFRLCPAPCLITDASASILDVNLAASQLLNVTPRHVVGRVFTLFLGGDRVEFMNLFNQTRLLGNVDRYPAQVRPRERAPFETSIVVAPDQSEQVLLMLLPAHSGNGGLDGNLTSLDLLELSPQVKSRRNRIAARPDSPVVGRSSGPSDTQ